MTYPTLHDLTFDVLYGCIAVLVYVILERSIYLTISAGVWPPGNGGRGRRR